MASIPLGFVAWPSIALTEGPPMPAGYKGLEVLFKDGTTRIKCHPENFDWSKFAVLPIIGYRIIWSYEHD